MSTRALALLLLAAACGKPARQPPPKTAVLKTTKGAITLKLLPEKAPKTVENFVLLAQGKKPWKDPKTNQQTLKPLYSGVPFFRVIPGLLVQTGDPRGDGEGDVGFSIPDELGGKFDRPGLVGMARWGPGTGASQFFITLKPMPDIDGQNALFAEVVDGLDVVKAIAKVPRNETDGSDRPFDPPLLTSVELR